MLFDQVSGAPRRLGAVGQHVKQLGQDLQDLCQDPAAQAAAAQRDECEDAHHSALAPGELSVRQETLRLVEKQAQAEHQAPELNPESKSSQRLASATPRGVAC